MKHFKRLTFVLLVVALLGLSGCMKKSTDLQPMKDIIKDIGSVYSLDTSWESGGFDDQLVRGSGVIILVDKNYNTINAVLTSKSTVGMIEIEYKHKLFSDEIKIVDLSINYVNISTKISIQVNFWDSQNFGTFESLDSLLNYLATYKVTDVYNLLYDLDYIRK